MLPCPEDLVPPDLPAHSNAGGWMLFAVVLAVLVYEGWAVKTGRPTISQWTKRKTTGHPWWKAVGLGVIGVTLWHLFFGGPL